MKISFLHINRAFALYAQLLLLSLKLLRSTDNWAFNIDRGNVNAVVFLDLKKAFDTVDRDILLPKMNLDGIQGIALVWFRSYLTNPYTTMSR